MKTALTDKGGDVAIFDKPIHLDTETFDEAAESHHKNADSMNAGNIVTVTPLAPGGEAWPNQLCFQIKEGTSKQRGGQGSVSFVEDSDGNSYAIKVFRKYRDAEIEWKHLTLFCEFSVLPEAKYIGKCSIGDGVQGYCVVMEEIRGQSLSQYVRKRERLSLECAMSLIRPILLLLAADKRHDLFHGDIKPENIMIQESGGKLIPRLIDLGISSTDPSETASRGTYPYSPPSVTFGSDSSSGRTSNDTFSLGATIVFMLTGKAPTYDVVFDRKERRLRYRTKAGLFESKNGSSSSEVKVLTSKYARNDDLRSITLRLSNRSLDGIRNMVLTELKKSFGIDPDLALVEECLLSAQSSFKDKTLSALARMLDIHDASRPASSEALYLFPQNNEAMLREVYVYALVAYLGGNSKTTEAPNRELDEQRRSQTFLEAYTNYNSGYYREAFLGFESLAIEYNDHSSMYNLAVMIEHGYGGSRDIYPEQMIAVFMRKAAEAGNTLAQYHYGTYLYFGTHGVTQSKEDGLNWIKKSATTDEQTGRQGFFLAEDFLSRKKQADSTE